MTKNHIEGSVNPNEEELSETKNKDAVILHHPLDLTKKPIIVSPLKKRFRDEFIDDTDTAFSNKKTKNFMICTKENEKTPEKTTITTTKQIHTNKILPITKLSKRAKVSRKLKFEENSLSPVSGTIIRPLEELKLIGNVITSGDIDPKYNNVEETVEAREEISTIFNIIGDYKCKLCQIVFDDAFDLARHRCSCIVLLEYSCPECGKKFNCPANLASHRRWHKPRVSSSNVKHIKSNSRSQLSCFNCNKSFKRLAYLKKHLLSHTNTSTAEALISEECIASINNNEIPDNLSNFEIVSHSLTEEENIAASALTSLWKEGRINFN